MTSENRPLYHFWYSQSCDDYEIDNPDTTLFDRRCRILGSEHHQFYHFKTIHPDNPRPDIKDVEYLGQGVVVSNRILRKGKRSSFSDEETEVLPVTTPREDAHA